MEQTTLGIGTRLQHTQYGPGVIVGIRYATYLISFINHGLKEIDKTDNKLDEIIPENVTEEIETHSDIEKSLLKILRLWGGINENVPLGDRWQHGMMLLQPADKKLSDEDKVGMQQYITRCYGSLTTFNVLFKNKEHWFVGDKGSHD